MNTSLKGNVVKNLASAFVNGLITLILLLIAPLGLTAVIFNTFAVFISTFFVTMAFDFIALWLLNSSRDQYFDKPLDRKKINLIRKKNNPNFLDKRDEE